jgi:protein phosphatase
MTNALALPADALVLLVGAAGSGKTTFAARHFAPTEVLSSDAMRAMVADDPTDQRATDDAFRLLHLALELRLRRRRLTIVDATNVEAWARGQLIDIASRSRRPAVAIVLDLPLEVCLERNLRRTDRHPPPAAIRRQQRWLHSSIPTMRNEGFVAVHVLRTVREVDATRIERVVSGLARAR